MSAETKFYNSFKKAMPPWWHFQRIETTTDSGVPDVNLYIPSTDYLKGIQWWIELKATNSTVYIRPSQNAWIKKRLSMGCKVAIIAKTKNELKIWNRFFEVEPISGKRLKILSTPTMITNEWGELEKILETC
tara:strand:+ start:581 stop:976 length:396 start_codon:yes stop_codon:yes gene_type:complete